MARRRRRNGTATAVAVLVLVFVVLGVAVAGVLVQRTLSASEPKVTVDEGQPVTVVVASGSTTKTIADQLYKAGVVGSAKKFVASVKNADAGAELKAGTYELTTGMPDDVVIEALVSGPVVKYTKVTIPEGFTNRQVAARIEEAVGIPASEFLGLANSGAAEFSAEHPYLAKAYKGSLQGYLFPKTYEIKEGATATEVIEMMLDQFDKETADIDLSFAQSRGLDLNEVVIAGSIIEREAKVAKERPLVSSVIYNRLKMGMKLQMCSTVQYILGTTRFRLTNRDIATPSPYNTYIHPGLPPGPIANPGRAALEAAAKPADTRYIYYVLTGKDGSQTFATNAQDFARAQQKSLEVFGQ
jgi:peptidoglycan lytic transglycosylase G